MEKQPPRGNRNARVLKKENSILSCGIRIKHSFRNTFKKKCVYVLVCVVLTLKIYPHETPQLDTLTLNTGLKIYLLHYGEDSTVNIKLVINGGKKNETECQVGYSEIIQQLLSETLHEKQNPILRENKVVCEIRDGQQIFSSNCSIRDLNKKMELISTVLAGLSFTKDKMDKVVSSLINQYKIENISSHRLSEIYTNQIVYGIKNPLGRSYCQYQLEKALPEDLREFYAQHYTPKRASIVICGNFNAGDVKRIVAKQFIKWRSFRKDANVGDGNDLKIPKIADREIVFINKRDSKIYLLKWVQSSPDFKSPDHLAFIVASKLFNTYLEEKIKGIKALEEDAFHFKPIVYTTHFMETSCIASLGAVSKAIHLFDTTLETFSKLKLSEKDLKEVVDHLKDQYLRNKTPKTILSFFDPLAYDYETRKKYLGDLSNIKLQEIERILKKYFHSRAYQLVIVGKESAVSNQLNLLENLTKYEASDFETCDEGCREVIIIKCHCESCYRRGQVHVWRFDPKDKSAIKNARARAKASLN